MAYTHTFQFDINGIDIEGEIDFDNTPSPKIKMVIGEEMELMEHAEVQKLYEHICLIFKKYGNIDLIEIKKKP